MARLATDSRQEMEPKLAMEPKLLKPKLATAPRLDREPKLDTKPRLVKLRLATVPRMATELRLDREPKVATEPPRLLTEPHRLLTEHPSRLLTAAKVATEVRLAAATLLKAMDTERIDLSRCSAPDNRLYTKIMSSTLVIDLCNTV